MSSKENNPGDFANRPTEEVKAITSKGGKASHGGHAEHHQVEEPLPGRNPDGTFIKRSEAAKEAGHKGGVHSHANDGLAKEESVSEIAVEDDTGRNADGTFKKGSVAAKEAGHKRGLAAASSQT